MPKDLIQFRRGTKAELDSLTSGNYPAVGEPIFLTDAGAEAIAIGKGSTVLPVIMGNSGASEHQNYIIVDGEGTPAENGAEFIAAYAAATALTPNGQALSSTNRTCVLLFPGTYDWTALGAFAPSDFVDIAGISGNRADVQLVGEWTPTTANYDVSNLTALSDNSFGGGYGSTFSGTATNCTGGYGSFAGNGGIFSGTAKDCTGGSSSFGSSGTFSGAATNCTGGDNSFGGYGTFAGTATNCTGGGASFGGSGTFSGTATNCTGGENSFGGGSGTFSGTATNCTGGSGAFGGYGGDFSGTATGCTGGGSSFGGDGGNFSGTATGCTGGDGGSFGGFGTFSGTATGCTGGYGSFGSGSTFSGTATITGCVGGTDSFGDGGTFSGATSVLFKDCRLTSGAFADPGDADVKIRRCINADLSEANFN